MARRPDRTRGRVMSASSLFAKIRDALVAVGRSERTATRKARLLEAAPFANFVRLTPEQNVRLGLSPKARHYVLKDVKRLSKATPTISAPIRNQTCARALQTDARTNDGSAPPRRSSLRVRRPNERVAKAAITREETKVIAEIKKLRASGEHVPSHSPDKRRHGWSQPITPGAGERYRELRRLKLAGQHIPDGDWHWFIDYARRFKDPRYELLRGSPAAFGFSLAS
jgi:hypothetical protein